MPLMRTLREPVKISLPTLLALKVSRMSSLPILACDDDLAWIKTSDGHTSLMDSPHGRRELSVKRVD